MAYADIPDPEIWHSRERWLQEMEESAQHPQASYLVSAQGTFLSRDMDLALPKAVTTGPVHTNCLEMTMTPSGYAEGETCSYMSERTRQPLTRPNCTGSRTTMSL